MTVPIESIKPGTVWRFKSGLRRVILIDYRRDGFPYEIVWTEPDNAAHDGRTLAGGFARRAIEQVTAAERIGGER